MRKVGILSLVSQESGGIYQYTMSLLEAIKLYSKKYDYVQIRYHDFPKILDSDIVINKQKSSFFLGLRRLLHTYTSFAMGDLAHNMSKKLLDIDIIISPIISLLPFHLKKPYIVTIHDFQQEYYPEFFSFKEKVLRKIVYRTGKFANIVVVESEYVKKDVIRFLGVNEEKVRILPSPPPLYVSKIKIEEDRLNELKEKYDLPDEYLFYPAQFWYHKNHIKLLEALHLITKRYGLQIPLIFVGSKKNNFDNVMQKIDDFNMRKQIRYLGYVPEEDMPYLYKLATALVMPTLFESVSMPIWEAFYLGCPVVSSNVCALPEQVGDAGLLFDPLNIEDMAEKIYKVWTDKDLRKELAKRGYEMVKYLTLENYAKQQEKIIEEVIKR